MIAAAPERRRGGVCVCVPRERAQRRGRGLATTAQRDASWMVDGGWWMVVNRGCSRAGQALTFRREREEWADSDRGQILAALSPGIAALLCWSTMLQQRRDFCRSWREGGGREEEGGRRRRNNLECRKKRRKRHEFHRQMAGGRPVRNSGSPHLPAAITLILPMAQTVCGREGQVQLRWMGSCVVPFCSGLFCPFVRTFAWPLSLSKCHSLSNLPFSAWMCTTKDDRPTDTPRRHIAHPP